MKLYIPTSTLNIDNILSSECIAPLSFYKGRDYGYNKFYPIRDIPYTNILLLFSDIPNFQIIDSEHHAFPLVIEVDIPNNSGDIKHIGEFDGINVYQTDDVIRLTPYNTAVLFFKSTDLNSAKLSCSDSLTNKLGEKFSFRLCRADFDLQYVFAKIDVVDICNDYENKVIKDNRLNRVKGFVFGYYLGVSKSLSSNSAELLKIQKRIYDIVASIKNEGGYNSSSFLDELSNLDSEYKKNDPATKQCRAEWLKYLETINIPADAIEALLEKYDENNTVKNSFMRKNGFSPSVSLRQHGFRNLEGYRNALTAHTASIVASDRKKLLDKFAESIKITFDLDPSYETCMLAKEDEETTLYNKFIARILWGDLNPTPESLRTDRFNIATEITKMARSIWEDSGMQWQDSSAQAFMNDLRQNIKNFTPFDINRHESIILKSVAIYILKGEDFDSLVQFCENNSINDYRYALALWGATQGYVKISRPILASLYKSAVFGRTLKEIIYLLHNFESDGDLPIVQEPITIPEPQIPQHGEEQPLSTDLSDWQDGIRKYFSQLKRVQKKDDLLAALEQAFEENGTNMDYVHFFAILNDYNQWKTSKGEPVKAWKNMVEHFCPNEYNERFGLSAKQEPRKKSNKNMGQRFLNLIGLSDEDTKQPSPNTQIKDSHVAMPARPRLLIIEDAMAISFIEQLSFENSDLKKKILDNFKDFIKGYQPGGYYYNNQHQYRRNNFDVIDHFSRWCFSDKNKRNRIDWTQDNQKEMERVKSILKKTYPD